MDNEYKKKKVTTGGKKENKRQESKKITIKVGVFFDGTSNNKYNVNFYEQGHTIKIADKENKKDYDNIKWKDILNGNTDYSSYRFCTRTNVAKLWYMYDTNRMTNSVKVYVEGPGTYRPSNQQKKGTLYNDEEGNVSSGKDDDRFGFTYGNGETGINAKIEAACSLVARQISMKIKDNPEVNEITIRLDVFGFSRGAAAARSFVSRMFEKKGETEGRNVCLKNHLKNYGIIASNRKIHMRIRLLGLFDTVSSYSNFVHVFPVYNDDVSELSLKIPTYVDRTVHLVAADEYRQYFGLTNINSAGKKGKEIILPGAHSDIGGGYMEEETEPIMMYGSTYGDRQCRGYLSFKGLHDGKWISDSFYNDWRTSWNRLGHESCLVRKVKGTYSRIPLYIMGKKMEGNRILLKESVFISSTLLTNSNLKVLRTKLLNKEMYKFEGGKVKFINDKDPDLKLIYAARTYYIHLSSRNEVGHYATQNNVRIIYNG